MDFSILIIVAVIAFVIFKYYEFTQKQGSKRKNNTPQGSDRSSPSPQQIPPPLQVDEYYIDYDGRAETGQQYPFDIVGEASYQENIARFVISRGDRSVFSEVEAVIQHEPTNNFDSNACKVTIQGLTVGYLAKNHAKSWLALLDRQSIPVMSKIKVKAVIVGGGDELHHYGIRLDIPERIANAGKYLIKVN